MTLTELITTLGPVGGVALFMWLNRSPRKDEKADPSAQKMDALIDEVKGLRSAFADFSKSMAILLDRSER